MIENQAYIFLIFIVNGIIIGVLFDLFRVLRKIFKTADIFTYMQDILFWLLTAFILLYSIFKFSSGEVRLYMFIAVFLGCLLYMLMLSKYFININVKIFLKIKFLLILPINVIKKIYNMTKKLKILKKLEGFLIKK